MRLLARLLFVAALIAPHAALALDPAKVPPITLGTGSAGDATALGVTANGASQTLGAMLGAVQGNTSAIASEVARAKAAEILFAPKANPVFSGVASTPAISITGSGSTGDLSSASAIPTSAASPGYLSRLFWDLGAGRITVDSTGLMTGLSGANFTGKASSTFFVRPSINYADGTALFSGSNDFSTGRTLEIIGSKIVLSPTNGLNIVLPPGQPGIYLNSTGPLTATTPGALHFNGFFNSVNAPITGTTDPSDSVNCQCVTNLQSSLNIGPGFTGVEAYGGSFGVVTSGPTNTISDLVGLASGVSSNFSGMSRLYGGNTGATVGPNGSTPFLLGHEADVTIANPNGTVPYRSGYNALSFGGYRATIGDGAFTLGCAGGSANVGGCWKHAMALLTFDQPNIPNSSPINNPIAPDGDIVWSERAITLAHVLNLPNVTVTGTILNFPGVVLTGNGKFTLGSAVLYAAAPTAGSGQVAYGGTTVAASYCGSLTGSKGCTVINVNGTQQYQPYF